jgi:hypothetical protein
MLVADPKVRPVQLLRPWRLSPRPLSALWGALLLSLAPLAAHASSVLGTISPPYTGTISTGSAAAADVEVCFGSFVCTNSSVGTVPRIFDALEVTLADVGSTFSTTWGDDGFAEAVDSLTNGVSEQHGWGIGPSGGGKASAGWFESNMTPIGDFSGFVIESIEMTLTSLDLDDLGGGDVEAGGTITLDVLGAPGDFVTDVLATDTFDLFGGASTPGGLGVVALSDADAVLVETPALVPELALVSYGSVLSAYDIQVVGGPATLELTFGYTQLGFFDDGALETTSVAVQHWNGSAWETLAPDAIDVVANTITVTTSDFSPFAVVAAPEPSDALVLCASLVLAGARARRLATRRRE